MSNKWTQEMVELQYISAQAEESAILEYKGAGAFGRTDAKRAEITKDVSAMANAAGGIIIYGVKEYDTDDKKHLPEKLDPIDRTEFSKEWLEQVINNIRPRIDGLIIYPVPVNVPIEPNSVVYIVEIPQSTTAHQAVDLKYYRRYNFQAIPMLDHEIRDVMNRVTTPDVEVEFSSTRIYNDSRGVLYQLGVVVKNQGLQVVNHVKLEFTFPDLNSIPPDWTPAPEKRIFLETRDLSEVQIEMEKRRIQVTYRSENILFPKDKIDIGKLIDLKYGDLDNYSDSKNIPPLEWTLYADDMLPRQGKISIFKFVTH